MLADSSNVAFLLIDGYSLLGVTTELRDPGLEYETVDRLYLGSAIEQPASARRGWRHRALLHFHDVYSRLLLWATALRLAR